MTADEHSSDDDQNAADSRQNAQNDVDDCENEEDTCTFIINIGSLNEWKTPEMNEIIKFNDSVITS